jgi:outer membrane protein assembly factor BamB
MKFTLIFLFYFLLAGIAAGQDLTIKPIWSISSDIQPVLQMSSGFGRVFVPLPNGVLEAIESETGNIAWKIELGGDFSDNIKVEKTKNSIFVLTEKSADGKKFLTLRSINPETGIVRWQRKFETISNTFRPKLYVSENLNVVSTELEIIASDNEKGLVVSRKQNSDKLSVARALSGHFLFEIRNLRDLIAIDLVNRGTERLLYQSKNEIRGKIIVDPSNLYISDILGNVFSFDLVKNRVSWQTRLGAEVLDIDSKSDSNSVLVVSKDIFFYQIKKTNGNKIRKLRLDASSFGEFAQLLASRSVVLSFDDQILIIEAKTGSIANRISLTSPIIFPAIVESNVVVVLTANGILAYK